jgi:hypothetical protein
MGQLLASIEAAVQRPGSRCSVATLLERLKPEDAADLVAALARAEIPTSAIIRALAAADHKLGEQAVARHRRKGCQCPTS